MEFKEIKQTIKEDIEYINDFNILEKYKDIMNDEYNDNDKLNDEFYDNGTVNGESIEIKKIHKENDDIYWKTKTHLINNNIDKLEDLKKFISTYDGGDVPEEYLNFGLTVDDFKQIYNKTLGSINFKIHK
jgi:hypothetical protein